jgi:GNAT superfamily N-acetyltransferase
MVVRLADLPAIAAAAALEQAEAVFFAASTVTEFASAAAREAFRERWFGRYLTHYPEDVLLAFQGDEAVGYLAGCPHNLFSEAAFAQSGRIASFQAASARFPAHLHVNIDGQSRNQGIGAALVQAYAGRLSGLGVPGVHVVTGQGARNVGFYERLGFVEAARTRLTAGHDVVLLGQMLPAASSVSRGTDVIA